ncbi:PucR family transcriptional regulator [Gottfriedia luciferensis]|uniref:PucR family transcriptional regulator n=1 Tax=Gottfriedia luciferensis TaxID=178774 RepID=UPI000B43F162|nr:helix-turn-helix domain-containing protein [Gottfriedia luciferensis]
MIDKMKTLFGEDSVSDTPDQNTYLNYVWFTTENQEIFGVKKTSLSEEQANLLKCLFTKLDANSIIMPSAQNEWLDYLYLNKGTNPFELENEVTLPVSIRFIHFHSNQLFSSKIEFEEAINAFFHKEVIVVWNTARKGVIIEKIMDQPFNKEFLEHMQEIIAADLYQDVTFFVGKRYDPLSNLSLNFDIEYQCFKNALSIKKQKNILWFSKEMLYYILSFLPENLQKELPSLFFNDMKMDDPILTTVKIYLQQNLNVTATSKKAFLHRNTVQYRLDKFSEQTGIDLKDFEDGFVIFLAIRLLELGYSN